MKHKLLLFVGLWLNLSIYAETAPNNALSFDGTNDYVLLDALSKDLPDLSKGFSFAGWIKWTKFKGNERLIDLASGPEFADNLIFRIDGASGALSLQSIVGNVGGGDSELKTTDILPLNSWCHVAATIDAAGNACIYLNGKLQKSGRINPPSNVARSCCYLGKSAWANDAYFSGSMDEVSFWNKALSKEDISGFLKKSLIGNEIGLLAYYTFNQGIPSGNNTSENILSGASTTVTHQGALTNFTLEGMESNFVEGVDFANIPHYLSVAPSVITFSGAQSAQSSFTVKCDVANWVSLYDCDWVNFHADELKPENITCFTTKVNDTGKKREASIVFSIPGTTIADTLTLYQGIEDIKLAVRTKSTGKKGQSHTIAVSSPVKSKASTKANWIIVPGDSLLANENLTFTVSANAANAVRTGVIYLNSPFAQDSLIVVQLAFEGDGTEISPYLITNYTDLKGVANDLNATYRLTADINASESRNENNGAGFEPIGTTESNCFSGMFHGAGHSISGLFINRPTTDYVALFGTKYSGTIDHLYLKDCDITGASYVGALVGRTFDYSQTNNCHSSGKVKGTGSINVGGLIGQAYHGCTISGCYSDCEVSGSNANLGGLVGLNEYDSNINNCYTTGKVKGTSSNTGGLVGDNRSSCIVSGCYSTGNVLGQGNYTGGLAGMNNGSVINSYTTGNIQGTEYVGGLVANNMSTVSNSYSTGLVSGLSFVSGCVGKKATSANLSNCYYNIQTSSCKDNDGRGVPLSIKQMTDQIAFSNWDFTTVWGLTPGKIYPALRGVNNAPFAFSDTLIAHSTFTFSRFLENDYDFETGTSKLTLSVKSVSKGTTNGMKWFLPETVQVGDTLSVIYRVGEIVTATDTLWGNETISKVVYERAKTNNALSFDGVNDFVQLQTLAEGSPDFSKGFSFAGWIKWKKFKGNERLIDLASGPEFANNLIFRIDGASGALSLQSIKGTTGVGDSEIKTTDVLPLGVWCHVAATIDYAGNACIYLNGVLQKTGKINPPVNVARSSCYLGKSAWANDVLFEGSMDEVSFWSKALSQAEISSYHQSRLVGTENGLLAYYPFNQGIQSGGNAGEVTLQDTTAGNHKGTLNNFALTGEESNFVEGVDFTNLPHYLNVAPSVINFSGELSAQSTVTIKCDVNNWVRLNDCEWATFTPNEQNSKLISCTTTKVNDTGQKRKADIYFSIPGSTITDTLTLYQEIEEVKLAMKTKSTGKIGKSHTVPVSIPVKYKASTKSSWITLPGDSLNANQNLTFSVADNSTNAVRTGTVYLNSRFAKDSLTVVQLAFDGDGDQLHPYLITNYTDLKGVAYDLNATYRLTRDIDASPSKNENAGMGFAPIGTSEVNCFSGTFKGGGHVISGLFINRPTTDYVALFGTKYSGTIDSLSLKDCDITGANYVGALVGRTFDYSQTNYCKSTGKVKGTGTVNVGGLIGQVYHGCTISGCFSACQVSGNNANIGGLVGLNEFESTISNSYATGSINGTSNAIGGLVGDNRSTCTLSGCFAIGDVSGGGSYTGGLAGMNNGVVTNCYASGNVQGVESVGGLVASNMSSVSKSYSVGRVTGLSNVGGCIGKKTAGSAIANCFYDSQKSYCADNDGRGNPLSTKLMKDSTNYAGWDFSTVWNQVNGKTYPVLRGMNNTPIAFSDTLKTDLKFDFSRLLLNDYDFETGTSNLTFSIKSISAGIQSENKWLLPETLKQNDSLFVTYRVGELLSAQDTLWGTQATSIVVFDTLFISVATNNSLHFDGENDYIQIKTLAKDKPDFSKGFSFAGWIKWDKFQGNERLIDLASGPEFGDNLIFRIDEATGVLSLQSIIGTTGNRNSELKTSDVLPLGVWCHVAATIDQTGKACIYYNGVQKATGTVNIPVNIARSNCYLGKSAWSNDVYFNGNMDDISFWNKALSQAEITDMHKSRLVGNESGLVLYYSFNQGRIASNNATYTTLLDATSAKNDAVLNNFALTGSQSNFVAGVDFTNIPHYLNVTPSTLTLSGAQSAYKTFNVKCDVPWIRLNDCDWATFSANAESPETIVCTTTKVNNSGVRRKADIYFSIQGTKIADTLTIYQDIEEVKLAMKTKSTGKKAQSVTVDVTVPVKWIPSTKSTWITVPIDSLAANEDLTFSVSENTSNVVRTGIIYVNSRFAKDSLMVVQLAFGGEGNKFFPYLITNYTDLKGVAYDLEAIYRITADIDASASISENGGLGFEPIGTNETKCFSGTIQGAGHVISGLYINRPTTDYVALIGAKNGGSIDSLSLKNCNITGASYVGSLVGRASDYTEIKKCHSTGKVRGTGMMNVGGLLGQAYHSCTISDSYSDCMVSGTNANMGGFIGLHEFDSNITDCYATGKVTSTSSNVGGFAGDNRNSCSLSGCYALGSVSGTNDIGGFAGSNGGTLSNIYANGKVSGTDFVGGLVGYNSSTVINGYSTGLVTGTTNVGGCLGKMNTGATLTGSFYNSTTSSRTDNDGRGTPLTNKQMMDGISFTGWNFTTVWGLTAGKSFPVLRAVNNAPFAFSDTLYSDLTFELPRLLDNDYDFETNRTRLTYSVKSISGGVLSGSNWLLPETAKQGDFYTLTYQVGELLADQDTLWGREATSRVVFDASYIADQTNNSLQFDGADDYIQLKTLAKDTPDFMNGFSFSGWVKWDQFKGNERLIDLASGEGYANNLALRVDGSSGVLVLQSVKGTTSADNSELKTPDILPLNAWCHVATTIDNAGNACLYLNGNLVKSGKVNIPVNVARTNCYLGKSSWANDVYFSGSMDEVSVWNKALTQNDITTIRKKNLKGNESGLVAYYPFNQGIIAGNNAKYTTLLDTTFADNDGGLKNFTLKGTQSNFMKGVDIANVPHWLEVNPSSLTLPGVPSAQSSCSVKCDTTWTRLTNCTWLTFEINKEKPGTVNCLTSEANATGIRRKADIVFSIPGTTLTDTLTIYQEADTLSEVDDTNVNKIIIGKRAQSQTVAVTLLSKVKATTKTTWITVPADSVAINGSLILSMSENTTNAVRTGIVYFNSRIVKDSLIVVQLALAGEGKASSPYLISDYSGLKNMTYNLNATYHLTADIDASASKNENEGAGFRPIGSSPANCFAGVFNGRGHSIYGLTINRPASNYVALFGIVSGGVIDSLALKDCAVSGFGYTGALVGQTSNKAKIRNCSSTGSVVGVGALNVGGLVGQNSGSSLISGCYSECQVSGNNINVGGLVGINESESRIKDSYATGNVRNTTANIGGMVGTNNITGTISGCYATGNITGEGLFSGGLAGMNNGKISNCYATGNVRGIDYVGGLVASSTDSVFNCFSSGRVTGVSNVGGFAGKKATGVSISNCYYNVESSSCKDNDGRGTPVAGKDMMKMNNFTGLNFTTTWNLITGMTYPALRAVNNAPVALSDKLTSNTTFDLSRLLENDFDFETGSSKLTVIVNSVSAGIIFGNNWLIPDSTAEGDTLTLTYRIGELSSSQRTLLGNEATAKIVFNKNFIIDPSTNENQLTIYPNPVTDGFNMDAGTEPATMSLFDFNGKRIIYTPVSGKIFVDISTLNPGMYMIYLNGKKAKIIKQ